MKPNICESYTPLIHLTSFEMGRSQWRKESDRLHLKTYIPAVKTCSAVKFNAGKAKEIMRYNFID
jgi:hypothetical protein